MSTELEEALLYLVNIAAIALIPWGAYGAVLFFRVIFGMPSKVNISGGTTVTENAADNIYTETAAKRTAHGVIEAAKIKANGDLEVVETQLKIENSKRERAGLPLIS